MKKSVVVIGDLESSRTLNDKQRAKVQKTLKKTLESINQANEALLSHYTITLGDEFQAVYQKIDEFLQHSWRIMATLHPVHVRFSIGIGSISTPINKEQSIGMDGPAFYAARDGIDQLKKNGFLYQIQSDDQPANPALFDAINASLHLISRQMRKWNQRRFSILYMLDQGMSIKNIAKQLDVSESAVYKNREEGSLDVILNLKKSLVTLINQEL